MFSFNWFPFFGKFRSRKQLCFLYYAFSIDVTYNLITQFGSKNNPVRFGRRLKTNLEAYIYGFGLCSRRWSLWIESTHIICAIGIKTDQVVYGSLDSPTWSSGKIRWCQPIMLAIFTVTDLFNTVIKIRKVFLTISNYQILTGSQVTIVGNRDTSRH